MPLVFGIGGTLVAMVGMNIGAGQERRALRIAFTGGAAAFVITESIGLAAAIWPESWLRLFDTDPAMLASGSTYLRIVGPFYGFYGLGFALYFAAQGAGRLLWPLMAGLLRLIVAALGGWFVLSLTGSEGWLYVALALGLVLYGTVITATTAMLDSCSWPPLGPSTSAGSQISMLPRKCCRRAVRRRTCRTDEAALVPVEGGWSHAAVTRLSPVA
jgi:Na+-driven multidrug efflux pump